MKLYTLLFLSSLFLWSCNSTEKKESKNTPSTTSDSEIDEIISKLSLEEKVGQMTNLTLSTIAE